MFVSAAHISRSFGLFMAIFRINQKVNLQSVFIAILRVPLSVLSPCISLLLTKENSYRLVQCYRQRLCELLKLLRYR